MFRAEIDRRHGSLRLHFIRIVAGDEAEIIIGEALQKLRYAVRRPHAGVGENVRRARPGDYAELSAHQPPRVKSRIARRFGVPDENRHPGKRSRLAFLPDGEVGAGHFGKRPAEIGGGGISPNMRAYALRARLHVQKRVVVDDRLDIAEPERLPRRRAAGENQTHRGNYIPHHILVHPFIHRSIHRVNGFM